MLNLFSSESVTPGHPDKTCDLIADSILDALLEQDPDSRSAVEVFASGKGIHIGGEVRSRANVDFEVLARGVLASIGWDGTNGLDPHGFPVSVEVIEQSPEIGGAVDGADELGAGDQGIMFGYATDETSELMPTPIMTAHALSRRLTSVRESGEVPWLRPDGKTQVTFEVAEDGRSIALRTVVVSAQHDRDVDLAEVRRVILSTVVETVTGTLPVSPALDVLVNPAGAWTVGGCLADTGLTGRKIIVDTYGGAARHGGGAFSGKDATKVDRSGAYAARQAAVSVVAAGLARRCEVQVAYAIGRSHPVGLGVETFGTGSRPDDELAGILQQHIDFRPAAIIERLGLRRPIFGGTACFGHFGRSEFPWEKPVSL